MYAHISHLVLNKGFCVEAHDAWLIIKHGVRRKGHLPSEKLRKLTVQSSFQQGDTLRNICRSYQWINRRVRRTKWASETQHIRQLENTSSHVLVVGPSMPWTAASVLCSYVPSNFLVPASMVCRGNLVANWELFRQQWEDYEIATGLDKRSSKVQLASLRSVVGKDFLQTFLNLNISVEDRNIVQACMNTLQNIEGMFSILGSKVKENQLSATSLAFRNLHRLVNLECLPMI